MKEKIKILLENKKVVISSGWDYSGIIQRLGGELPQDWNLENLEIQASNGTYYCSFDPSGKRTIHHLHSFEEKDHKIIEEIIKDTVTKYLTENFIEDFGKEDIEYTVTTYLTENFIEDFLKEVIKNKEDIKNQINQIKENMEIEFRGTQISCMLLGKEATYKQKINFFENYDFRKEILKEIQSKIEEKGLKTWVLSGGKATIDITPTLDGNPITKAYGIEQIARKHKTQVSNILYIGDELQQKGSNDDPLNNIPDLDTQNIKHIDETRALISKILTFDLSKETEEKIGELTVQTAQSQCIFFDLDATLVESKYPLTKAMAQQLATLLQSKKIAIITGGKIEIIIKNIVEPLKKQTNIKLENLTLLPLVGAETWTYTSEKEEYQCISQNEKYIFDKREIQAITKVIEKIPETKEGHTITINEQLESRGTGKIKMLAYSHFGQNVPEADKEKKLGWDPEKTKREKIIEKIKKGLEEEGLNPEDYEIRIGGSSSIDITKKGLNKASGMSEHANCNNLDLTKTVFIGDSLIKGNDNPALNTGALCIQTTLEETEKFITRINRTNI